MAFGDQRRLHLTGLARGQAKPLELVALGAAAVANVHHGIQQVRRGQVDHALLAAADHLEAVVLFPDIAGQQRRLEPHHHMPAHRHDVALTLPGRTHQHDGAGFKEAPDF